jgi:acyl-CoA synthetase (AMP-forming)/AMP-acid ligase II
MNSYNVEDKKFKGGSPEPTVYVLNALRGESHVRSRFFLDCYTLMNCKMSKEASDFKDGWWYSDDLVKVDENGFYYVVDRKIVKKD